MLALVDVGFTGKAVAGAVLGLGLLWFLVKMVREGQKAEQDKVSAQNWVVQEEANKEVQAQARAAAEAAKNAKNPDPTDF